MYHTLYAVWFDLGLLIWVTSGTLSYCSFLYLTVQSIYYIALQIETIICTDPDAVDTPGFSIKSGDTDSNFAVYNNGTLYLTSGGYYLIRDGERR